MRWAILIGVKKYDNGTVTKPQYSVVDATLVHDTLVNRYQMAPEQALLLNDPDRVRLEQGIPGFLSRIGNEGSLLVFFSGRAYKDDEGKVYLAPKDIDPAHVAETGLALQWLVDEMEKCPAKDKLLLIDCDHAGSGADLASEPSGQEIIRSLKAAPSRGPLRTISAILSCKTGQRSADWPEKRHGLFAWLVAQGYGGEAASGSNRVESSALFAYLSDAMAAAAAPLNVSQAPSSLPPIRGHRDSRTTPRSPSANWPLTLASPTPIRPTRRTTTRRPTRRQTTEKSPSRPCSMDCCC